MDPGIGRDVVLRGRQAGRLGRRPAAARRRSPHDATAWLSPDDDLGDARRLRRRAGDGSRGGVPPVTPDAFDPAALGGKPPPRRPLQDAAGDRRLAVDAARHRARARARAGNGVKVMREPHLGTGISKSLARRLGQAVGRAGRASDKPDAVVVFIGANEGFPMPGPGGKEVECCGADWAAAYANRVRADDEHLPPERRGARLLADAADAARPGPRATIARVVNAAIARRRRAVARARCACSTRSRSSRPRALPRRDAIDGERHDRPRARRHPPQRHRCSLVGRHRDQADRSGLRHKALTMSARGTTVRAVSSRFYIPSALLSVVVALTVSAGASASPIASAAKTCTPPKYPGSGYFTSLSVTGTSCSTGSKIAKDYYKCRTRARPQGPLRQEGRRLRLPRDARVDRHRDQRPRHLQEGQGDREALLPAEFGLGGHPLRPTPIIRP